MTDTDFEINQDCFIVEANTRQCLQRGMNKVVPHRLVICVLQ